MKPNQSTRFWDSIAGRYAQHPIDDQIAYQRKLEITRGYLRPEMRLLEFGCGTGSTAIAHAACVEHVLATDLSTNMLQIAEEKAATEGVANITFQRASIEEFAASNESFDVVLCLSLLHLLEDRATALAKIHALLKPGGVFVSSTVCITGAMRLIRFVAPLGRLLGLMPIIKVFSKSELLASIAAAGFSIDHQWQPEKGKAVFIVARKPDT